MWYISIEVSICLSNMKKAKSFSLSFSLSLSCRRKFRYVEFSRRGAGKLRKRGTRFRTYPRRRNSTDLYLWNRRRYLDHSFCIVLVIISPAYSSNFVRFVPIRIKLLTILCKPNFGSFGRKKFIFWRNLRVFQIGRNRFLRATWFSKWFR